MKLYNTCTTYTHVESVPIIIGYQTAVHAHQYHNKYEFKAYEKHSDALLILILGIVLMQVMELVWVLYWS